MMTWVGGMVSLFFCLTVMMMMMTITRAVLIKRFQKQIKREQWNCLLLLCSALLCGFRTTCLPRYLLPPRRPCSDSR